MKKKILICIILLSISFCYSQEKKGIVIYKKEKLNYLSESDDFREKNKGRIAYLDKILDIDNNSKMLLKELDFKLFFNNNKSSFRAVPRLEVEDNRYMKIAIGGSGRGIYYTDIKENKYYRSLHSYGENFIIKFTKRIWVLINETKRIGSYSCYKATSIKKITGRNGVIEKEIVAWYAPDINIPFGPLEYSGLPGLIIELTVGEEKYVLNKIELNLNETIEIKKPTKGKVVTKKEFDEIGVTIMNDFKKSF